MEVFFALWSIPSITAVFPSNALLLPIRPQEHSIICNALCCLDYSVAVVGGVELLLCSLHLLGNWKWPSVLASVAFAVEDVYCLPEYIP